jgi:BolA protein
MSITEEIKHKLQSLEPTFIELEDESSLHAGHRGNNGGGHFKLTITSPRFNELPPVARHRLVYEALNELIPHKIHALSIRAQSAN